MSTLTQALSSYWAEKDGLRRCQRCGGYATLEAMGITRFQFCVTCDDCGWSAGYDANADIVIKKWNTQRTADPIIRELQARLELAESRLEHIAQMNDHNFRFGDAIRGARETLTTLSTDEWISK